MTWLRPENASNVVFQGQGHLVSAFLCLLRFSRADGVCSSCAMKCPGDSVSMKSIREVVKVSNRYLRSRITVVLEVRAWISEV